MSINYAILGFLSWQPMTGYNLKKMFSEAAAMHWSGNNNQIYKALVQLHQDGLVTQKIEDQESGPSRKVYTITSKGLTALKLWTMSEPELPQVKNTFLVQLLWADQLNESELDEVVGRYEEEVRVRLLMVQEQKQRQAVFPGRAGRHRAGRAHRIARAV